MQSHIKDFIENNIELIETERYEELFDITGCPSGLGYVLYQAGIDFLSHMQKIPSGCFGNTELTSIDIPEGVQEIDSFAFADASSLKHVKLPSSLQVLGNQIFYGCFKLFQIEYAGTVEDFRILNNHNTAWSFNSRVSKIRCSDGTFITNKR